MCRSSFHIYRSTLLCQTCLSQIHGICRSDHPFPSISPILLCISNLFMPNSIILKPWVYRSGFSFPKNSFPLLHHYLCRSKICVGQKIKERKNRCHHMGAEKVLTNACRCADWLESNMEFFQFHILCDILKLRNMNKMAVSSFHEFKSM